MSIAPPAAARSTAPGPRRLVHPTHRWWRDAAGAIAWASLGIVTALWLSGGGLTDLLGGPAAAVTSIGRITGLVASDLLLLQVLLMARLPFVERSYGQDELARRHRLVGFWSFTLMAVHIAFITYGYALAAGRNPLAELWNLVWTYPGMLLATAGTAALTMVVVTSIRAARGRLRYESWHLLHLYAYLGVGLALPHQLWTGADFLSSPAATVFWWAPTSRPRHRSSSTGSGCRHTALAGTVPSSVASRRRHRAWCRCTSAVATLTGCRCGRGSSSSGGSSTGPAGRAGTPTPCRPPRTASCASPSRTSVPAAPGRLRCGRARGC
jgi:DMSO/TMAO reductase YedYZ heme-binding membrane subunit